MTNEQAQQKYAIGLIGLGAMGRNLVLNMADHGFSEAWSMRMVLGIAAVLGVVGVIASFGLSQLSRRVWRLSQDTIQTLMYLKLSGAVQG
jgi:6-phosphogluconate dehydrogenase (decarboxylating)